MMAAGASRLFHAIHGHRPPEREGSSLVVPSTFTGMGVLAWLEVRRANGREETWRFSDPRPRLCFTRVTRDTNSGRSALWLVGGHYRVGRRGFQNLGGHSPLHRISLEDARRALPSITNKYRRTHGGMNPHEALKGHIDLTSELVTVGECLAVTYWANKREDGPANYRHEFETPPDVMVTADGGQIVLSGGSLTVTPHGIEDVEP